MDFGETVNVPRLGCGAAILKDDAILLLVQRLREPESGCWGLPGGKIDWLEPVENAVVREVHEELGITLSHLKLLCVVDQIDQFKGEHWVSPVYVTSHFDGAPELIEPDKHAAFGWFALHDLPKQLTVATYKAVEALS